MITLNEFPAKFITLSKQSRLPAAANSIFTSAPLLDPNRRGEEIESLAQPVDQISFVGKMQLGLCARSEDDERRRAYPSLRQIQNFQFVAIRDCRARLFQMLFKNLFNCAVGILRLRASFARLIKSGSLTTRCPVSAEMKTIGA